ncbi:MAG: type II secretion system protein [Desulfobacterales bacterium]|nr:type II secretion system protein [Desulfobacterales bacterium]
MTHFIRFRPKDQYKGRGFTLIELIVVITLISIMMFFAAPRLSTNMLSSDERQVSKWIVLTVKSLKKNAVRGQIRHILHVDLDNNKLWTSVDVPQIDALEEMAQKKKGSYEMPDGFQLLDVQYPDGRKEDSGVAEICFFKKGYSDHAMIHLEDDDANRMTYEVEPFLLHVQIHEEYLEF